MYCVFLKLYRLLMLWRGKCGLRLFISYGWLLMLEPTTILQALYLAIISATYYFIGKSSFSYMPGYYLSEIHMYVLNQKHACVLPEYWFSIDCILKLYNVKIFLQIHKLFGGCYWCYTLSIDELFWSRNC